MGVRTGPANDLPETRCYQAGCAIESLRFAALAGGVSLLVSVNARIGRLMGLIARLLGPPYLPHTKTESENEGDQKEIRNDAAVSVHE